MKSMILGYNRTVQTERRGGVSAPLAVTPEGLVPMQAQDTPNPIPHGYCQCGCGERTKIGKRGQPNRFLAYHRNRLQVVTPNDYQTSEDGTIVMSLSRGFETVIDAEDYPIVSSQRWYAHITTTNVYAANKPVKNGPSYLMHRALTNVANNMMVDHIDGDGLNNRRSNLRESSNRQNQQNRKLDSANTSGFKGVSWHIRDKFWRANIRVDGRSRFLGSFNTPEEAARAYDAVAREAYGEFARLNFPHEGEQAA